MIKKNCKTSTSVNNSASAPIHIIDSRDKVIIHVNIYRYNILRIVSPSNYINYNMNVK